MTTITNFEKPVLPLDKMKQLLPDAKEVYASAEPFPHIHFDNFFNEEVAQKALQEFPGENDIDWINYYDGNQKKLANEDEKNMGLFTRDVLYSLNSSLFLRFLEELTGIGGLISDPAFRGGGLHNIYRGGKLGIHADFNKHTKHNLERRLNLLFYLNKDWKEEYGGHIELWDRGMKHCVRRYLPVFNRVVIFTTTDFSFHGHPDPLNCPDTMSRKSLALYYYSQGRSEEETSGQHSTIFKTRPGEIIESGLMLKAKKFFRRVSAKIKK